MSQAPAPRTAMGVLAALMAYWGYVEALNGAAAPFLAREFDLDDAGIAWVFGWISFAALGTFVLSRRADRIGRRRTLLLCLAMLPPAALASAAAPTLLVFVLAQIAAHAVKGALYTVAPVMVAEALTTERRAWGQGVVGFAGVLGGGTALIVVAACAEVPGSWRWGWAAAALGMAALPFVRIRLPESVRFERAVAAGETQRAWARELLGRRYRARSLGTLGATLLFTLAIMATQTWLIYHPVRELGLAPLLVTIAVISGGAVGLLGFPLGGHLAESWGRRATFAVAATLYAPAAVGFYHVPADLEPSPAVGVAVAFAAMSTLGNIAMVALRSSQTELFPTRLRGTQLGWLAMAMAVAAITAQFAAGGLALWLGGLAPAVSLLALLMVPAALVFLALVPETRGLGLEAAALEEEACDPTGTRAELACDD